jgi:hypothetical protein
MRSGLLLAVACCSCVLAGCTGEPYLVAEPALDDGPSHTLHFEFSNTAEHAIEIEVRIDGLLVVEGPVPDRGAEHCRSITGPLDVIVTEGHHAFTLEPSFAVVPWELDVTQSTWIAVSTSHSPTRGEDLAFISLGPVERRCR